MVTAANLVSYDMDAIGGHHAPTAAAVMISDNIGGDVFDQIDELLDFPEDVETDSLMPMAEAALPERHHHHHQAVSSANRPAERGSSGDALQAVPALVDLFLTAPGDVGDRRLVLQAQCDELDVEQLEWLSAFFDDSNLLPEEEQLLIPNMSCPAPVKEASIIADAGVGFQSTSPISVLERSVGGLLVGNTQIRANSSSISNSGSVRLAASSSCSSSSSLSGTGGSCGMPKLPEAPFAGTFIPARARTKRPRPSQPHLTIPFMPVVPDDRADSTPHGSVLLYTAFSDPESIAESTPQAPVAKKKKKSQPAGPALLCDVPVDEDGDVRTRGGGPVRRCTHCQIEKTPQWRAGPQGPKTLCNACGVRYKSGRLFPEYRPAASPTFVPALHSNSHKKVVEMRLKTPGGGTDDPSCDLLRCIRQRA